MGGGVFCKKVENGGVVVKKSGKWECLCKKVDLSSMQGALCTASVFFILHFVLIWGCVCTHPTHPPAYGPGQSSGVLGGIHGYTAYTNLRGFFDSVY